MLKNKAGLWKSDDSWTFTTEDDDLIYIENRLKTKVLGATSDGKVILEVFVAGKAEQLWKKGVPNDEDYFTLENSKVLKVMTAISPTSLELKGNSNFARQCGRVSSGWHGSVAASSGVLAGVAGTL